MTCDDIRQKLKPFLEDLLVEQEYTAFCEHIETCNKCAVYARSIGSLSNQLWKLGQIEVPEDLISTIQYKLAHPEEKAQPSKSAISKKHIVIGSILIFLAGGIFFGISHFRNKQYQEEKGTPIIKTEVIRTFEPPSDREAQSLLNQLEAIATRLGVSEKGKIAEEESGEESISIEKDPIPEKSPIEGQAILSKTSFLHWHILCSEKYRKETGFSSRLLDAVSAAGIRLDYQKNDILVFNSTGEKIEQLLEQILLLTQDAPSFRDFTAAIPTFRGKEYTVSIYLEHEESNALHWHIDPIMPNKKSELLGIIREFDNSRDYESDGLVIFTISNTDLGRFRARIQATRVPFAEYGSPESKENSLSSGPITISIYFTR